MAQIPSEVKEAFTRIKACVLGTAAPDGQPNGCVVAMKTVIDDETLYLSDQFFKKTLANLEVNPRVSIAFWDDDAAYQIHGTARYVNEGADFEEQKAWVDAAFEKLGMPVTAKGGIFVTVDSVYQMKGGPDAGDQIA